MSTNSGGETDLGYRTVLGAVRALLPGSTRAADVLTCTLVRAEIFDYDLSNAKAVKRSRTRRSKKKKNKESLSSSYSSTTSSSSLGKKRQRILAASTSTNSTTTSTSTSTCTSAGDVADVTDVQIDMTVAAAPDASAAAAAATAAAATAAGGVDGGVDGGGSSSSSQVSDGHEKLAKLGLPSAFTGRRCVSRGGVKRTKYTAAAAATTTTTTITAATDAAAAAAKTKTTKTLSLASDWRLIASHDDLNWLDFWSKQYRAVVRNFYYWTPSSSALAAAAAASAAADTTTETGSFAEMRAMVSDGYDASTTTLMRDPRAGEIGRDGLPWEEHYEFAYWSLFSWYWRRTWLSASTNTAQYAFHTANNDSSMHWNENHESRQEVHLNENHEKELGGGDNYECAAAAVAAVSDGDDVAVALETRVSVHMHRYAHYIFRQLRLASDTHCSFPISLTLGRKASSALDLRAAAIETVESLSLLAASQEEEDEMEGKKEQESAVKIQAEAAEIIETVTEDDGGSSFAATAPSLTAEVVAVEAPTLSASPAKSKRTAKYWSQRYRLFSRFDEGIKLDEESWYSVTPERIASHIAARCVYSVDDVVLDGFCGVGGNAIQFAMRCHHVIAVDIDPVKIACARHNAALYGVADRIEFIVGNFFKVIPALRTRMIDVVFLSPPWGGPEYLAQPLFDVRLMMPAKVPFHEILALAANLTSNLAVFMPRTTDIFQLMETARPAVVEIEQNCLNGKVKTLTAYYGPRFTSQ